MKSYLQMYKDIEQKLDRKLTMDEIRFLQWVFIRFEEEKKHLPA